MAKSFTNGLKKSLELMEQKINSIQYDPLPNLASTDEFLLSNLDAFDYEGELFEIEQKTLQGLQSLANVYLDKELLEQPYIQYKIEKDAKDLASLEQLCRDSQRSLIEISKKINQGSDDLFIAKAAIQKEMRENIKFSTTYLMNVENFYKKIQDEISLYKNIIPSSTEIPNIESVEITPENKLTTNRKDLNELIKEAIKNKK
jgi:DNA polymerase II small subunit/DNA polymerase delta subunit B